MDDSPTEDELHGFVEAMLSNLDKQLRKPEVVEEAIRNHRDMWTKLYQASLELRHPPGGVDLGKKRPPSRDG